MAIFTAAATGSSMFNLFSFAPGFANFAIGGISGTASQATVTNVANSHELVYSGSSLGWTGAVPDSGTYTSIQVSVGGTLHGTLAGFSAQNFADITVAAGATSNAFSMLNGNDTLNGDAGTDFLFGGYAGSDTFNGNGGNDTFFVAAQFSFPQPVHVFNGAAGSDDTVVILPAVLGSQILDFTTSSFSSIESIRVGNGVQAAVYASQFGSGISTSAVFSNFTVEGRLIINVNVASTFDMSQFSGDISVLEIFGNSSGNTVIGSDLFGELMRGNDGDDDLQGNGGSDTLIGGSNDDTLSGGSANDFLNGGTGDDWLDGGTETDQAIYINAASAVTVSLAIVGAQNVGGGEGNDTLIGIEDLEGSNFDDTLIGNGGSNVLVGRFGNDTLIGGALNDIMNGAQGDDTYDVDVANDLVQEAAGQGTADTVRSGNLSLDLANYSNVENLALTGTLSRNLTGDAADNLLTGNDGNNILNGKGGSNTLTGGRGNDTFVFDGTGNVTVTDFASTYFSAVMSGANEATPNASTATGAGTLVLNLGQTRAAIEIKTTGLDWDGAQTVSNSDNVSGYHIHMAPVGVSGGVVEDLSSDPDKLVFASEGRMTSVWTSAGDGMTPALVTSLISGNLYYNIHTVAFGGGEIRGQIANASTKADKINVSVLNIGDFATLQAMMFDFNGDTRMVRNLNGVVTALELDNVSEANLLASHFTLATGNVAQTINGGNAKDDLFGAGGNDTINGGGADDRLFGEADNDTLNGGAGIDHMYGGAGNDTFFVDNLGDTVFESALAGGGVDRILTAISMGAMESGVENLTLTGALAIIGIGNSLGNVINGSTNTAANSLRGMAGNDIYVLGVGDTANETVAGSSGIDTVQSAFAQTLTTDVERLQLTGTGAVNGTGNLLANVLTGNSAANILNGGAGVDTMNGGVGADTLIGGLGIDILRGGDALLDKFQFNALNEVGDIIADFDAADLIVLKASAFLGLTAANKAANFVVQANNHNAVDANDRLIFNQADDTLWYDSNGSTTGGFIIKIADLNIAFTLSAADILMV